MKASYSAGCDLVTAEIGGILERPAKRGVCAVSPASRDKVTPDEREIVARHPAIGVKADFGPSGYGPRKNNIPRGRGPHPHTRAARRGAPVFTSDQKVCGTRLRRKTVSI
jgi:hypothetical protein